MRSSPLGNRVESPASVSTSAAAAAVLVSLLVLAGCPGSLDPNQFPATRTGGTGPCDAPAEIIRPICGKPGLCHSAGGAFGDFATAPEMLIDRDTFFNLATNPACNNTKLIKANTLPPEGSLITRIMGDGCGADNRMPPPSDSEALTPAQVQCVLTWVEGLMGANLQAEEDAEVLSAHTR
jgi:hypothetical protein